MFLSYLLVTVFTFPPRSICLPRFDALYGALVWLSLKFWHLFALLTMRSQTKFRVNSRSAFLELVEGALNV